MAEFPLEKAEAAEAGNYSLSLGTGPFKLGWLFCFVLKQEVAIVDTAHCSH